MKESRRNSILLAIMFSLLLTTASAINASRAFATRCLRFQEAIDGRLIDKKPEQITKSALLSVAKDPRLQHAAVWAESEKDGKEVIIIEREDTALFGWLRARYGYFVTFDKSGRLESSEWYYIPQTF